MKSKKSKKSKKLKYNTEEVCQGVYPSTVSEDQYDARIDKDGKEEFLGRFNTVDEASHAFCTAQGAWLRVLADSPDADHPDVKAGLLRWAEIYEKAAVQAMDAFEATKINENKA
jgi:hypothetical protein